MKKILIIALVSLIFSCSKSTEKPVISIAQYSEQVVVMNGVVLKILNEPDPKKMKAMADAMETARAVSCVPVVDECNAYYKIINKVVNFTKDGKITNDQKMELFKMQNEFQNQIRAGELKIREEWSAYIREQASSVKK